MLNVLIMTILIEIAFTIVGIVKKTTTTTTTTKKKMPCFGIRLKIKTIFGEVKKKFYLFNRLTLKRPTSQLLATPVPVACISPKL